GGAGGSMGVTTSPDGIKEIRTPLSDADVESLRAGDRVRITGVLYTARDAAHGRLDRLIEKGERLPFDPRGQIIYYTGPSPARPGDVVGSIGPTTASRMDKFTPSLLGLGLKGTIGKGYRSQAVRDALRAHKGVYFGAIGGAGAVLSPFYSPCLSKSCLHLTLPWGLPAFTFPIIGVVSPALLILWGPALFRLTCYYYRKAYYRSFWLAPVACAVKDVKAGYTGETRFPLILQNFHRYAWYVALIFIVFLTWDAILAFRFPDGFGIGAGGAGLRAAIEAAAQGVSVGLICKSLLGKAHTVMAEGGIAAALGNVWPEDTWQVHFRDTMRGGKMLNNWRMAQLHAQEAPERVLELERWGALFDRTKDGRILQRDFGGHRYARLAHVGDRTGLEMIRTLQYHGIHQGIDVYMECTIARLLKDGERVSGAVGYWRPHGKVVLFKAKAVVLATGGIGKAWKITSNSWEYTGDGHALALWAGADLIDMEFVQFHPTGMVWPPSVRGI